MLDNIFSEPILGIIPFLIVIHVIVGVLTAIKEKRFKMRKVSDFIFKGTMFFGFMLMLDVINNSSENGQFGAFVVAGIQTLRGVAWLAIVGYYLATIYGKLTRLGMPKLAIFENELKNQNLKKKKESK